MFTIKPLVRKNPVTFSVRPMVRKQLSPVQDRASFIKMLCDSGVSYQNAVREFDKKQKARK